MTLFSKELKKCAVCGSESFQNVLVSTSYFGSPDLDGRPPPLARWALTEEIEVCPSCGYCAPDISKKVDGAEEVVKSESYRKQLHDPDFPDLANAFLCYSMIMENTGNYAEAGIACVKAAWVCDDYGKEDAARRCRIKAASLLKEARRRKQRFAKKVGEEIAMIVDLLRRSGQFEEALRLCEEGLKKRLSDNIKKILIFQIKLIKNGDVSCHEISEALESD